LKKGVAGAIHRVVTPRPGTAPLHPLLRAAWLVLVASVLLLARTSHLALPWAALLAPAACAVCRGCPVEHDHEVCDCEACQQEAAGHHHGASLLKNPPHGGPGGLASADEARFLLPAPLRVLRYEILLTELGTEVPPLTSLAPPPPPLPPPRATA